MRGSENQEGNLRRDGNGDNPDEGSCSPSHIRRAGRGGRAAEEIGV